MMKLRRSLTILLLLFISTISVRAQDAPIAPTAWPITKRCIGNLPEALPQEKWTFEGVIFSDNGSGVRAIRTDVPTSYYVAFDDDRSFAFDGSFSPDGKRFAYPTGTTSYATMLSNAISVNALQVVTTDPHQMKLTIPWDDFSFSGAVRGLSAPNWLDSEHFVSKGVVHGTDSNSLTTVDSLNIINALTGDVMPLHGNTSIFGFSPDAERAIFYSSRVEGGPTFKLYDVKNGKVISDFPKGFRFLAWLPNSSGFIATIYQRDDHGTATVSLINFDKNGSVKDAGLINIPASISSAVISPDGNRAAFFVGTEFYIAELDTRQIADLCFDIRTGNYSAAWSPDSTNFVVSYDGLPLIVNYETLEMQRLGYEINRIWGWYSVE